MNTDCTDITDEESVLIRVIRVQKKSNYPSATKTKKNVKITPILLKHLKSSKITKNHSRATTNCSLSLYKAIFGCCPLVVRLMSACCPLLKRTTSGHQADNKRTTTSVGRGQLRRKRSDSSHFDRRRSGGGTAAAF